MEFDSSKKSLFPTKMIKVQRKETMKMFGLRISNFWKLPPQYLRVLGYKKFEIRFILC